MNFNTVFSNDSLGFNSANRYVVSPADEILRAIERSVREYENLTKNKVKTEEQTIEEDLLPQEQQSVKEEQSKSVQAQTEEPQRKSNIIGNTAYRNIRNKVYRRMAADVGERLLAEFNSTEIKYSGRINNDNTITFTFGGTDIKAVNNVISKVNSKGREKKEAEKPSRQQRQQSKPRHRSFTHEEINIARNTNLVDFLNRQGEELKKVGQTEYTMKAHDSMRINGNKYYWNSRSFGGNALDFCMKYYGMSFQDSVAQLLAYNGYNLYEDLQAQPVPKPIEQPKVEKEEKKPEHPEPIPNPVDTRTNRVYAYLTKTRGISPDIVNKLIADGKIVQDTMGNAVFKIFDAEGNLSGAEINGTATGRRFKELTEWKGNTFVINPTGEKPEKAVFVESAIDAISFYNLHRDSTELIVSMAGLKQQAVLNTMKRYGLTAENCLIASDNDEKGIEFMEKMKNEYNINSYPLKDDWHYSAFAYGLDAQEQENIKDWNDLLKAERNTVTEYMKNYINSDEIFTPNVEYGKLLSIAAEIYDYENSKHNLEPKAAELVERYRNGENVYAEMGKYLGCSSKVDTRLGETDLSVKEDEKGITFGYGDTERTFTWEGFGKGQIDYLKNYFIDYLQDLYDRETQPVINDYGVDLNDWENSEKSIREVERLENLLSRLNDKEPASHITADENIKGRNNFINEEADKNKILRENFIENYFNSNKIFAPNIDSYKLISIAEEFFNYEGYWHIDDKNIAAVAERYRSGEDVYSDITKALGGDAFIKTIYLTDEEKTTTGIASGYIELSAETSDKGITFKCEETEKFFTWEDFGKGQFNYIKNNYRNHIQNLYDRETQPVINDYGVSLNDRENSEESLREVERLENLLSRLNGKELTVNLVGEFYELYGEEAQTAAEVLGLHITQKEINGVKTPMVGFPKFTLDTNIKKLSDNGYTVNINENTVQIEQKKETTAVGNETFTPEYIYKMEANPQTTGRENLYFIQSYITKENGKADIGDILYMGTPEKCREFMEQLKAGTITQAEVKELYANEHHKESIEEQTDSPTQRAEKKNGVIGNTAYRYISKKTYRKFDNETAEKIVSAFDEAGLKYSGIVREKETTLTFSGNDLEQAQFVIGSITKVVTNKKEQVQATESVSEPSFAEQVDSVLNGTANRYNDLKVCNTPQILIDAGLEQLPILYTQKHLRDALMPRGTTGEAIHHHGLTADVIKKVPEAIEKPVMIYDSLSRNDSIVVLTDLIDGNNNPIIAAIRPNGNGRYNLDVVPSNFMMSIHGRENVDKQIENAVKADKLLYCDKEKSQDLFRVLGLQLSEGVNNHLDYNVIIHQSRNIVKKNQEKTAEKSEKNKTNGVIGNTEYKYIPKKTYRKFDHETAEKIAAAFDEAGLKYSGKVGEKTTTLTFSGNNLEQAQAVIDRITKAEPDRENNAQNEQNIVSEDSEKSSENTILRPLNHNEIEDYISIKEEFSDSLVGYELDGYFQFYGKDAQRVSEILKRKVFERQIENNVTSMTAIPAGKWISSGSRWYFPYIKEIWSRGENIYLAEKNKDGTHQLMQYFRSEDYLPLNTIVNIDGRKYNIENVDFSKGMATLRDIAKGNDNQPLFINEPVDYVRSYYEEEEHEENTFNYRKNITQNKQNIPSENSEKSSIQFGLLGNGITVFDTSKENNGDYLTVAHISNEGAVNFYVNDLKESDKELIQKEADRQKAVFTEDWNKLSNEVKYERILSTANAGQMVQISSDNISMEDAVKKYEHSIIFKDEAFPADNNKNAVAELTKDDIDSVFFKADEPTKDIKYRVYRQFDSLQYRVNRNERSKNNIDFLKNEYGTYSAAHDFPDGAKGNIYFNNKEVSIVKQGTFSDPDIIFRWADVESRINTLIREGRYFSDEEKEYYPKYLESIKAPQYEIDNYMKDVRRKFIADKSVLPPSEKRDSLALRLSDFIRDLDNYERKLLENVGRTDLANISADEMEKHLGEPETVQQLIDFLNDVQWKTTDVYSRGNSFNFRQELSELYPMRYICKPDDIVYIDSSKFEVLEAVNNNYVIRNVDMPLDTRGLSSEELQEQLSRSTGNDKYKKIIIENLAQSEQISSDITPNSEQTQNKAANTKINVNNMLQQSFPQNIIDLFLLHGSNTVNGRKIAATELMKQKSAEETAESLKNIYHGGFGIQAENKTVSAWYAEDGIHLSSGRTARYDNNAQIISWGEAAERIGQLLSEGRFATNAELVEADSFEREQLSTDILYLYRDLSDEGRNLNLLSSVSAAFDNRRYSFPDMEKTLSDNLINSDFRKALSADLAVFKEAYEQNPDVMRFRPRRLDRIEKNLRELELPRRSYETNMSAVPSANTFITDDEINADLAMGSGFSEGKIRIYNYFTETHTSKEKADFLKNEYGTGGLSHALSGAVYSGQKHSSNGIEYNKPGCENVKLNWPQAAKRIEELIDNDRYLSLEEKNQLNEKIIEEQIKAQEQPLEDEIKNDSVKGDSSVEAGQNKEEAVAYVPLYKNTADYAREHGELDSYRASNRENRRCRADIEKAINENYDGRTLNENALNDVLNKYGVERLSYIFASTIKDKNYDSRFSRQNREWANTIDTSFRNPDSPSDIINSHSTVVNGLIDLFRKELEKEPVIKFEQEITENAVRAGLESENELPTITCEFSESPVFEGGKTYSAAEFDRLMREADKKFTDGKAEAIKFYGSMEDWDEVSYSEDKYREFIGYNKVQFTVNMPDGSKITERQDIGDGYGGVIDYLRSFEKFSSAVDILEAAVNGIINQTALENSAQIEQNKTAEYGSGETEIVNKPQNYRITDYDFISGNAKERFRDNINAIKTLFTVESEGRQATPEEQEILAKYVGWGGLALAFDVRETAWANEYKELKELLPEDLYKSARATVNDSFYTPPVVIDAVYKAIENMGFKNGKILEPSMGVGNFFGMLPENLSSSKLYGVEIDDLSGRIAKQLYPNAHIQIKGFEKTAFTSNSFDVAVGNVPFGTQYINDKDFKGSNLIHDYFFKKALDKVRPGGVVAFITSMGTLDKKDSSVRRYLAERADLLGAVRLPDNTFKKNAGTDVTSDIIFLQKRETPRNLEKDGTPDWVNLSQNQDNITMNSYFVNNPEMILGEMKEVSGRFGPTTVCRPFENADLAELLDKAVSNIKGSIEPYEIERDTLPPEVNSVIDPEGHRNFCYDVIDGDVYYRENDIMTKTDFNKIRYKDAPERLKGMIEISRCVQELIRLQLENYSAEAISNQQDVLNALYDNFTEKYGLLSGRTNSMLFKEDDTFPLLQSLENINEKGELVGKADIFFKRTIIPHVEIDSVDTAAEALAVSIAEKAKADLDYMAELCSKYKDEIITELEGVIFENPVTEQYETADEYLSGNVREKLNKGFKLKSPLKSLMNSTKKKIAWKSSMLLCQYSIMIRH